jgi:Ca2+-binding RTX toxin-like protein
MRRAVILLTVVGAVLVLAGGVALAATIQCDGGTCRGTNKGDTIHGTGGFDRIYGRDGQDEIYGKTGGDELYGGDLGDRIDGGYGWDEIRGGGGRDWIDAHNGNDHVDVADGRLDSVSCGIGTDTVVVDAVDLSAEASVEDFTRATSCEHIRPE